MECEHEWRAYGSYRRVDGTRVRRRQCRVCGITAAEHVDTARYGLKAGNRAVGTGPAYDRFWSAVLKEYTRVGMRAALEHARRIAGVSASTVSRWIAHALERPERTPVLLGERDEQCAGFLRSCLEAYRRPRSIERKRTPIGPEPGPVDRSAVDAIQRTIDEEYETFWDAITQARAMASVVLGRSFPNWLSRLGPGETDLLGSPLWSVWTSMEEEYYAIDLREFLWHAAPDPWWLGPEANEWWERLDPAIRDGGWIWDAVIGNAYCTAEDHFPGWSADLDALCVRRILDVPLPPWLDYWIDIRVRTAVLEERRRVDLDRLPAQDRDVERGLTYLLRFADRSLTVEVRAGKRRVGWATRELTSPAIPSVEMVLMFPPTGEDCNEGRVYVHAASPTNSRQCSQLTLSVVERATLIRNGGR